MQENIICVKYSWCAAFFSTAAENKLYLFSYSNNKSSKKKYSSP